MIWVLIVALLVSWGSVYWILRRGKTYTNLTMSDHVVSGPRRLVYAVANLLFMLLFFVWIQSWLYLPDLAVIFICVAMAAHLFGVIIPRYGNLTIAHDISSTVAGIFMVATLVIIYLDPNFSSTAKTIAIIASLSLGLLGFDLLKRGTANYLYKQLYFYGGWQVALAALYLLSK